MKEDMLKNTINGTYTRNWKIATKLLNYMITGDTW